MGLDIRLPIGLMFSLIGLLLTFAGITLDPSQLKRSLDININLYWGIFLILFGAFMLIGALRSRKNGGTPPSA